MNTCKLYSKKIWDKSQCSVIITVILCITVIATGMYLQYYSLADNPSTANNPNTTRSVILHNIRDSNNTNSTILDKPTPMYIYIIYTVPCGLLFIHSLEIYTNTMQYKNKQKWAVLISMFTTVGYYMAHTIIGGAIYETGSFYRNIFFSYIYLMYTAVILNAITNPILTCWSFFEDNNLIKLISNKILIGKENDNNLMSSGLHVSIFHGVSSMIMLGVAFMFNLQKIPYYIASILTVSLSVLVVTCKLLLSKKYIDSINNDPLLHKRAKKKEPIFC